MMKRMVLPITTLLFALLACSVDLGESNKPEDLSLQQTAAALDATSQLLMATLQESALATVAASSVAEGTQEASKETEIASPTTSSPTPNDSPVPGSLIRAIWDPAADWGDPHDFEDFNAGEGMFGDFSAGASRAWSGEDGRFHLTFTTRGRYVWSWSFLNVEDFYADVVIINGDECVSGDNAGMIFHGRQLGYHGGYMFGINCGGEYKMQAMAGGSERTYFRPILNGTLGELDDHGSGWIHSDLIDTGPGAVNRIGVWGVGGQFDFYINGAWADGFYFDSFPWVSLIGVDVTHYEDPMGQFALYLGTAQKDNAAVSFDDFSVWEGLQH